MHISDLFTVHEVREMRSVNGTNTVSVGAWCQKRFKREGEKDDYVQLDFWGKDADTIVKHVGKGRQLMVSGDLKVRTYEKQDKTTGISLDIRVESFKFGKDDQTGAAVAQPEAKPERQREYDDE